MLRVLRGNDNELEKSAVWLARCLQKVADCDLDDMVFAMSKSLDECSTVTPLDAMLPYHSEIKEFVGAIFTAQKLTPAGDLVNYISFARFDMWKLTKCVEWQHWVKYMHGATIMRMVECDRQSRLQGRLVRVVTIIDVAECTLGMFNCMKFHRDHSRDLGSFQESVAAEIFGQVVVLNAPWVLKKLVAGLMHFLPERFRQKLKLVNGDGTDDPDFIRLVGGDAQLRQLLAVRESIFQTGPRGMRPELQMIPRRGVFVHSLDVLPGQQLLWEFEVLPGHGDGLLGASDAAFSADALWTDMAGAKRLVESAPLEALRRVSVAHGKVRGSFEVARPGVIFLRWSNAHGPLRRKTVRFAVALSPAPLPAEASAHRGGAGSAGPIWACCCQERN